MSWGGSAGFAERRARTERDRSAGGDGVDCLDPTVLRGATVPHGPELEPSLVNPVARYGSPVCLVHRGDLDRARGLGIRLNSQLGAHDQSALRTMGSAILHPVIAIIVL
jgi:hypothetical protein